MTITYGSGARARPRRRRGRAAWQAKSKASRRRRVTNLGASPSITVAPPPASAVALPGRGHAVRHRVVDSRLRRRRLLRHRDRRLGDRAAEGRAHDPPGRRQLLERQRLLERDAGVRPATGTSAWSYGFPASSFPADGAYTVQVRATDNLNGVETPSSRTFTVDRTPPSAFALDTPAAGFVGQPPPSRQLRSTPEAPGSRSSSSAPAPAGLLVRLAGTPIGTGSPPRLAVAGVGPFGPDRRRGNTRSSRARRTRPATRPTRDDDRDARQGPPATTTTRPPARSLGRDRQPHGQRRRRLGRRLDELPRRRRRLADRDERFIPAPANHANDGAHAIDYYSSTTSATPKTIRRRSVTIDTQPPSGTPVDPGSTLSGTVNLSDPSPTTPAPASLRSRSSTRRTEPAAGRRSAARPPRPGRCSSTQQLSPTASTTYASDLGRRPRERHHDRPAGPQGDRQHATECAAVTDPAAGAYVAGTVTLDRRRGPTSRRASGRWCSRSTARSSERSTGTPASVDWDSTSTPTGRCP